MHRIVLAAALAVATLALAACASSAGTQSVASQAAPAASTHAKAQQMVCSSSPAIGSHIAQTTCLTKARYKAQQTARENSRKGLEKMEQEAPSPKACNGPTC